MRPRRPNALLACLFAAALLGKAVAGDDDVDHDIQAAKAQPETALPEESRARYDHPVLIEFHQPVTRLSEEYLNRALDQAEEDGADLVIVEITSPGGELDTTLRVAHRLGNLKAHTVAYIPEYAYSGGAVIALACDDVIMAPTAHVGDVGVIAEDLGMYKYVPEKALTPFIEEVRSLARAKGRPPGLADAMIDKAAVLWKVRERGSGKITYMTEREIESDENPAKWEKVKRVHESGKGKFLTVNGQTAVELQLAAATVPDEAKLHEYYHLQVVPARYRWTWVETAVTILNSPWITGLLFIVGLIALYIEFSMPGIALGGLTAVLCFSLFFWSHFLGGTAGWLEIVLFAAGLMFLAVELFVLPGFGVAGLTGIVLLLVSVVMACQGFLVPRTPAEWSMLTQNLLVVAVSGVIGAVAMVYLSTRMGTLPVFNKLILKPPTAEEQAGRRALATDAPPAAADAQQASKPEIRLGDQGVAQSALRPAGIVRFGKQSVDVVTDGEFVARNSRVEVMEISGNRIVVREVG